MNIQRLFLITFPLLVGLAFPSLVFSLPLDCPDCPQPDKEITIEYFTFNEGFAQIVKDTNDPNFPECFLGYFIPYAGETVITSDNQEMTFKFPEGWTFPDPNDKRYHKSPGGAPGVDFFGWVDTACKVHLFDKNDTVHAWKAGPVIVVNEDNDEVQIGHRAGSFDLYLHVDPSVKEGNSCNAGDKAGTLTDLSEKGGTHLHFSVNVEGTHKNPLTFMAKHTKTCIPEPATMLLLGTGLVGLMGFRKKFKKDIGVFIFDKS